MSLNSSQSPKSILLLQTRCLSFQVKAFQVLMGGFSVTLHLLSNSFYLTSRRDGKFMEEKHTFLENELYLLQRFFWKIVLSTFSVVLLRMLFMHYIHRVFFEVFGLPICCDFPVHFVGLYLTVLSLLLDLPILWGKM